MSTVPPCTEDDRDVAAQRGAAEGLDRDLAAAFLLHQLGEALHAEAMRMIAALHVGHAQATCGSCATAAAGCGEGECGHGRDDCFEFMTSLLSEKGRRKRTLGDVAVESRLRRVRIVSFDAPVRRDVGLEASGARCRCPARVRSGSATVPSARARRAEGIAQRVVRRSRTRTAGSAGPGRAIRAAPPRTAATAQKLMPVPQTCGISGTSNAWHSAAIRSPSLKPPHSARSGCTISSAPRDR